MARAKYRITGRDMIVAKRYLSRKLESDYWLTDDASREIEAKREYQESIRDEVTLNGWCEKWLKRDQWTQLKDTIRAARKRAADRTGDRMPGVHVTLSRTAWMMLRDLASRDGVTLSEFLENRLGDEWREADR